MIFHACLSVPGRVISGPTVTLDGGEARESFHRTNSPQSLDNGARVGYNTWGRV